jgi:hypothetical protein
LGFRSFLFYVLSFVRPKESTKEKGGNGKAASHPARAHAQKDYVSRNNILDGLGRRRPGPPPAGPLGRRAAVASPAALIPFSV